jgi:hypothetical protein
MARFFDDLIQCHRHDGKPRRNHSGRNGELSFPTGRGGFRQKAALIIFPEAMRHLPTAATTGSGLSAISEGRVPQAPIFQASKDVAALRSPKSFFSRARGFFWSAVGTASLLHQNRIHIQPHNILIGDYHGVPDARRNSLPKISESRGKCGNFTPRYPHSKAPAWL